MIADENRYLKYDTSVPVTQATYINNSCTSDKGRYVLLLFSFPLFPLFFHPPCPSSPPSPSLLSPLRLSQSPANNPPSDDGNPTVVGEFSLSVPDDVQFTADWDPSTQQAFYTQWFAAQITTYEKDTNGWIFWAWKAQLGDYRWSYVGMLCLFIFVPFSVRGRGEGGGGGEGRDLGKFQMKRMTEANSVTGAVAAGVIPSNFSQLQTNACASSAA